MRLLSTPAAPIMDCVATDRPWHKRGRDLVGSGVVMAVAATDMHYLFLMRHAEHSEGHLTARGSDHVRQVAIWASGSRPTGAANRIAESALVHDCRGIRSTRIRRPANARNIEGRTTPDRAAGQAFRTPS
jgi:hypothetical protein